MSQRTLLIAIVLVVASSGCETKRKNEPVLHRVQGRVALDGQPLPGARVIFTPKGGGRSMISETDRNGRYDLAYNRDRSGALAGDYVVCIRTGRDPEEDPNTGDESAAIPETLPAIYNAKSTLKATVPGGDYQFDLKSVRTAAASTSTARQHK